jgi:hypothetical protein
MAGGSTRWRRAIALYRRNLAAFVHIRALCAMAAVASRAAWILREMAERGERAIGGGDLRKEFPETPSDLSLTKRQSYVWQKLAELEDDAFTERLTEARLAAWTALEMTADERQAEKRERREARERDLGERQLAYPTKLYGLILCDDEWDHELWSRETGMDRHAANHYPTATDAHTAAEMHERTKARFTPAPDCLLAMWSTRRT